jgi:hypothetical protein
MLSNRSYASIEVGWARDKLKNETLSSISHTIGAGYFREFDLGFSAGINYSFTRSDFDEPELYYPQDFDEIQDGEYCYAWLTLSCDRMRRDKTHTVSVSINSNTINFMGIFPSIRWTYMQRDSNIYTHDFKRHRVEVLGSYRF